MFCRWVPPACIFSSCSTLWAVSICALVTLLPRSSLLIEKARELLLMPICRAQQVHVLVWLVGASSVSNSSNSTEQST